MSQVGDEIKARVDDLWLSREIYKKQCEQMFKTLTTLSVLLGEGGTCR